MIYTFDKKDNYPKKYLTFIIPIDDEKYDNGNVLEELRYNSLSNCNLSGNDIKEYISKYYNDVLSKLDPLEIARELRCSILVSNERSNSIALRHIVSEWISIYSDDYVVEVKKDNNDKYIKLDRPSFIKNMLIDVIKDSKDMKGFKSLRALYLYEKSEELRNNAIILNEKTGNVFNHLLEDSFRLKCKSKFEESNYNRKLVYDRSYYRRRNYKR